MTPRQDLVRRLVRIAATVAVAEATTDTVVQGIVVVVGLTIITYLSPFGD